MRGVHAFVKVIPHVYCRKANVEFTIVCFNSTTSFPWPEGGRINGVPLYFKVFFDRWGGAVLLRSTRSVKAMTDHDT